MFQKLPEDLQVVPENPGFLVGLSQEERSLDLGEDELRDLAGGQLLPEDPRLFPLLETPLPGFRATVRGGS